LKQKNEKQCKKHLSQSSAGINQGTRPSSKRNSEETNGKCQATALKVNKKINGKHC